MVKPLFLSANISQIKIIENINFFQGEAFKDTEFIILCHLRDALTERKHHFYGLGPKGGGPWTPVQNFWDPLHEYTRDFQNLVKEHDF